MVYNGNIKELLLEIKHIMIDHQLRQTDLAAKTGLSKQTISNLINGRQKNITLDTLQTLANSVDCEIEITLKPRSEIVNNDNP